MATNRPIGYLAGLMLLACSSTRVTPRGETAPPVSAAHGDPEDSDDVLSCDAWNRSPMPGSAVAINNVWNKQCTGERLYSQCLLRRPLPDGRRQFGWRWDWPREKCPASYALPEALIGWKAWDGGKPTLAGLPRRLNALESLKVDFAVKVKADPAYNLIAAMWLTATDRATIAPNPSDIRANIIVSFDHPAGLDLGRGLTDDGEVILAGTPFHRWHQEGHTDAAGSSTQTWTMIIYAGRDNRQAGSLDLKLVLDDCVTRGLVNPSYAVGGVELATEVFAGKGELWIDRFSVTVK